MEIFEKIIQANQLLNKGELDKTELFCNEIEGELINIKETKDHQYIQSNLGAVLIDLGSWKGSTKLINRGIKHIETTLDKRSEKDIGRVHENYNIGNGYYALWQDQIRQKTSMVGGKIDENYIKSKQHYRNALKLAQQNILKIEKNVYVEIHVNYANMLDTIGRCVEAVTHYDLAIQMSPNKGEALGNKGILLKKMSLSAHGLTHNFILEAKELLENAITRPIPIVVKEGFDANLNQINQFIKGHKKGFKPKKLSATKPKNKFEKFLMGFCTKNNLYLTPATFLSETRMLVTSDPMFLSQIITPISGNDKADRYITFLNEIKENYVISRYFLVQSQYQLSNLDIVDRGVDLYYPLDYSYTGSYLQLLKTAFKLSVDLLDKIAFFIKDYCQLEVKDRDIYFRSIFSKEKDKTSLKDELASKNNLFLYALLDLSLDLRKGEYLEHIYERRSAITHRFLVIHDMLLEKKKDNIERITIDEFKEETLKTLQLAKAAIIYLILFVEAEESKKSKGTKTFPTFGYKADELNRWKPYNIKVK